MVTVEKVSTVGIRNQVTLPKPVREELNIGEKSLAYIQAAVKEGKYLIITLQPPEAGVYNKIKISEKGQLVIPKNLRESTGIYEGTNLVFSVIGGNEIRIQKLKERKTDQFSKRWSFLVEVLDTLSQITDLDNLDVEGNSLFVTISKKKGSTDNLVTELVTKLESMIGTRLIIEKKDDTKLKLTPLG
ncbi:MAG: AbrB/MazE/SpoVT family DNA-binding domain-containing protein [Candidatus Odinarchaeota archaeon]